MDYCKGRRSLIVWLLFWLDACFINYLFNLFIYNEIFIICSVDGWITTVWGLAGGDAMADGIGDGCDEWLLSVVFYYSNKSFYILVFISY
jgi:hypothetical protein